MASQIETIERLLAPMIEDRGYELVDVQLRNEHGRRVLRLLVDRPGGIRLDECASVSREAATHLEVADPLAGAFVLEVSSPGIHRPLTRPGDYERFRDEKVVVRTREPRAGQKTFAGINRGLDDDGRVVVEDRETGVRHALPLADIRDARLDPDIRF